MRWVVIALAAWWAYGKLLPDVWSGFIYPNREQLPSHIAIGDFDSLEACRVAALDALARITIQRGPATTDFECGLNCKAEHGMRGKLCEETRR